MLLDDFSDSEKRILKDIAVEALREAVTMRRKLLVDLECPKRLLLPGASFVTLTKGGQLRGCIGSLEAIRPLLEDVAHNAYSAALHDPRFNPVEVEELAAVELSISVLTEPQTVVAESEAQLLASLEPGVDGVIIEEGHHRATYLPSVWTQLPDPVDFIRELKRKAHLPAAYWSDSIKCYKYQSLTIK